MPSSKQSEACKFEVSVHGIVIERGKILLAKEGKGEGWATPACTLELGENPECAARRAVFEKASYKVEPMFVCGITTEEKELHVFFRAKITELFGVSGGAGFFTKAEVDDLIGKNKLAPYEVETLKSLQF